MNAYFFKMTNEERNNILDQHKQVYDGYVTSYIQPEKNQPLYVQDLANDKEGLTVSNKGVVTGYKNMNINEMKHDGKSTGLFSDEEPKEQGHVSPGAIYDTEETFESEEQDEYFVSLGENLDMIGDGEDDLEHGTFDDDEDFGTMRSRFFDSEDDFEDDDLVFDFDSEIMKDIDDEEVEGLFDDLQESLDMFKRFTKYN
jgi:hypothetical protein